MLDNGYVYLAATRMALFRSDTDWPLTIEVFGFSPRSGCPDTHIHTFASSLCNRNPESNYVFREAYENYLRTNPHNESRFIYAMEEGPWIHDEDGELVSEAADAVQIRGARVPIPGPSAFAELGIDLEEPPRLAIFELCRALAASHREALLATNEELRVNVQADMAELLRLDQWHHPNVIDDDERPSGSPTFQQLAAVVGQRRRIARQADARPQHPLEKLARRGLPVAGPGATTEELEWHLLLNATSPISMASSRWSPSSSRWNREPRASRA